MDNIVSLCLQHLLQDTVNSNIILDGLAGSITFIKRSDFFFLLFVSKLRVSIAKSLVSRFDTKINIKGYTILTILKFIIIGNFRFWKFFFTKF